MKLFVSPLQLCSLCHPNVKINPRQNKIRGNVKEVCFANHVQTVLLRMHQYFMYLCRVYMLLSTWKSIMPRVVLGSLSFCKTRSCRDATRQNLHAIPTHDHPLVRVGAHSLAARNFQIFAQQKECLSLC